jgi:outer membrane protein assembly factor BamA
MTHRLILLFILLIATRAPAYGLAGDGFTIERVEIRGNQKTRSEIIHRALTLQEGETLSSSGVDASKLALERTRLFTTVHLASKPGTKPNHAVVVVYVVEKRFGDLGISGEYTELDGFGVTADAYHVNLAGEGKIIGAAWGAGERFKQWRFNYADPWLTRANLLFSIRISGSSADRDLFRTKDPQARGRYDLERIGGSLALGKGIGLNHRLLLRYAYQQVQVGAFKRPTVVTDRGEFADEVGLAVGRESLAFIGLDLHTEPSTEPWGSVPGSSSLLRVDVSGKYLGASGTFLKLEGEHYQHLGVRDKQILTLGARAGIILGSEPFYERFFLDGQRQLRGFERREIGPEGGEEFFTAEVLYSIPFSQVGRAYAFVEGATVRRDFVTGTRADQGATVGIGVLLFNRIDISLGVGTGTLIIKSHRFGGINVGL